MRRAVLSLICLALLLQAALPALPGFVCLGMGGRHLTHPCCPAKEVAASPQWQGKCCQPAAPVALSAQLPPRAARPEAAPVLSAAPLPLPAPPALSAWAPGPAPRGGAPPERPPQRRILRI